MAMGSIIAAFTTAGIVNIATQFDTDPSDIGIVSCATIPLAKARLSAASPGAQLPLLIRGVYYEGWRPAETPTKERQPAEFAALEASQLPPNFGREACGR